MSVYIRLEKPTAFTRELPVEAIPNLMHQPYEPYYGALTEDSSSLITWGYDLSLVILEATWKGFKLLNTH